MPTGPLYPETAWEWYSGRARRSVAAYRGLLTPAPTDRVPNRREATGRRIAVGAAAAVGGTVAAISYVLGTISPIFLLDPADASREMTEPTLFGAVRLLPMYAAVGLFCFGCSRLAQGGAFRGRPIRSRSTATVGRWPVWEVAFGPDTARGERRGDARALLAVGDRATGLVAVGRFARGGLAVGFLPVGVFAAGPVACGAFAVGGAACGAAAVGGWACGGAAAGFAAVGVAAAGCFAFGGLAAGAVAVGGAAAGAIAVGWVAWGALAAGVFAASATAQPWATHAVGPGGAAPAARAFFATHLPAALPTPCPQATRAQGER